MVVLDQSSPYDGGVLPPVCERVRERVPGFDPAEFWQELPLSQAWSSMLAKYEALASAGRLAAGPRGEDYRIALIDLASRWPGALREGELIGPVRVEARRAAAEAGVLDPARARATWPGEAAQAVICWAELHGMIRDLLDFRRAPSRRGHEGVGSADAFARWIAAGGTAVDRAARWPKPERLETIVGPKLRVRSAYLWLAARAGLDLPGLNELLLARAGHWDRRDDDPLWAHEHTRPGT
jgi:hypothetical protein